MRRALLIVPAMLAFAGGAVAAATATTAAKHATVKTRSGDLGTYLVDGRGRTLYLFRKDKTRRSTCKGACAAA
jgi:predicted lipoprotein with Yx(FWY)xxD motif